MPNPRTLNNSDLSKCPQWGDPCYAKNHDPAYFHKPHSDCPYSRDENDLRLIRCTVPDVIVCLDCPRPGNNREITGK